MEWDAVRELAADTKTRRIYIAHVRRYGSGWREVRDAVRLVARADRLAKQKMRGRFASGL
ncbi:hypothetical protein [Acetobacter oeni]|uniref:hypothetical protein n=1 Tax=Acetobacter oeni TaxID=304077 RepID=UPI001649C204|nr:hypothetical protein [Acetobacter oeni]MBB3881509.1 hypothetical protein [Acetobacter oeni]NHO18373.1 hypothetical protein [Acetobacter oeni]